MPLSRHDAEELLDQLYATAEVLGSEIKPAAATLMIRDLRDYNRLEIEQALARCRSEITGRLTLASILDRMPTANVHLSANEAWSIVLMSRDEQATVIWTDEIAKAAGVANPILEIGDKVGARMAFIAAYEREIASSKAEGRTVRWWPSLGNSKELRRESIEQGIKDGRLPAPDVEHLLPAPSQLEDKTGGIPENVQLVLQHLRNMLKDSNDKAEEHRRREAAALEQRREEMLAQAEKQMAKRETATQGGA